MRFYNFVCASITTALSAQFPNQPISTQHCIPCLEPEFVRSESADVQHSDQIITACLHPIGLQVCEDAIASVVKEFGKLDILVLNAAEQHLRDSITDISPEQLHRTFKTNVLRCVPCYSFNRGSQAGSIKKGAGFLEVFKYNAIFPLLLQHVLLGQSCTTTPEAWLFYYHLHLSGCVQR